MSFGNELEMFWNFSCFKENVFDDPESLRVQSYSCLI